MNSTRPKIVLAGGSGFLGQVLARWFAGSGFDVVVLTRGAAGRRGDVRFVQWDGENSGPWTDELEGARALINFSGRSVNCRYHRRNRRQMIESRVNSTRILGEAIARCECPPQVWLNASTATIYKHSLERAMDEKGEIGWTREAKDEFSVQIAQAWEEAFEAAATPHTRKVTLRMAMVLGSGSNSVFPALRALARFGLAGPLAGGAQYVSWIHEDDLCRAVEWIIGNDGFRGIVNLAAPNPVPNREVMRIFRSECGLPFGLPAPLWLLELGAWVLRTETELLIKSRRVVPGRLLSEGFQFRFERMEDAVREIEHRIRVPHERLRAITR